MAPGAPRRAAALAAAVSSLLFGLAFGPPARAAAPPVSLGASYGPPAELGTQWIFDRATLESWGVPHPTHLAFDREGPLYILDAGRRRMVKVRLDRFGEPLLQEIALSDEPSSRVEPGGIVVDARGSVLVLDRTSSSILAYDKNGALVASRPFAADLTDEVRDPRSEFFQDSFGKLWLVAPRERDLVRLDATLARDRNARFLTPEERVGVLGTAVSTPNGETWVANASTGSLDRYRPSGALIGAVRPPDSTGVAGPRIEALASDFAGYVYAGDVSGQRILVFDDRGAPVLERVLGGGSHPWRPSILAWGFADRLAVADPERGEVQVLVIARRGGPR